MLFRCRAPRDVPAAGRGPGTGTGGRRAFLTLFYGVLDPATGRLDFVCAGHPFPLLRRQDGAIEELGEESLPLGLRRDLALRPQGSTLVPGARPSRSTTA